MEDLGSASSYNSGLMGVWQVLDGNAAIVTSWQNGQGYEVRIYGCRDGHLEQWLDEWSLGVATVSLDTQTQMPMVTAPDRDGAQPVIWKWDGKRYASSGGR
jgi:hypothetical protein